MAEVVFNKYIMVVFILYLQLEVFYFFCYNPIIQFSKALKIGKLLTSGTSFFLKLNNSYFFFIFFTLLFFNKQLSSIVLSLLFFSFLFFVKLNNVFFKFYEHKSKNNVIYFLLPSFGVFFFFVYFVDSFLILFFFIELYGVLYYFCFLTSYSFTNQTILKYKNGLLLLLWNNFLTTLFLTIGCFLLLRSSASTSFLELNYLTVSEGGVICFLIGFFWKLGLPLFHFFKLEIYKYLLKENVFFFSLLTTLINLNLLFIIFTQPVVFSVIYSHNLFIICSMFSILLGILNLKLTNILQFFALSGVFTIITVITVFLL